MATKQSIIPKANLNIKLKDIYQSVSEITRSQKLKELKKKDANKKKLTEEQLNESIVGRWLTKFFEKVKNNEADDIVKTAVKKDPKLGNALNNMKKNYDELHDLLIKKYGQEDYNELVNKFMNA